MAPLTKLYSIQKRGWRLTSLLLKFFSNSEEEPAAQFESTADAAAVHREHIIGTSLEAMLGAGVSADGGSDKELGSVMKVSVLSEGELTLVRRSKWNAETADVHSLEKTKKKLLSRTSKLPMVTNLQIQFVLFLIVVSRKT